MQRSSYEIQVEIDDSFLCSMYAFVLVEESDALLLYVRIIIIINTEIVPTPSGTGNLRHWQTNTNLTENSAIFLMNSPINFLMHNSVPINLSPTVQLHSAN
jgi:hypothetical protein